MTITGIVGDRVLVEPISQREHETASGLYTVEHDIPDVIGRVIACPARQDDLHVDDVVLFPPSAGQRLEFANTRYLMLDLDEVIGVWES